MRVKVLASGVSFADILLRKGVHPESWKSWKNTIYSGMGRCRHCRKIRRQSVNLANRSDGCRFTNSWRVCRIYISVIKSEWLPVPPGLDHAEAVSLVLNYTTAYQMLHRCAHIKSGEIILINGGGCWRCWYSTTPIGQAC